MRSPRIPNQALRALLAEADWSGAQLARSLNALAAGQGTVLSYDRTTVAHWLAGSRPPAPVPSLVAEVLSRRLGRLVPDGDTGLTPPERIGTTDHAPVLEGAAAQHLEEALRAIDGRGAASLGVYSLAALTVPHGRPGTCRRPLRGANPPKTGNAPKTVGAEQVTSAQTLLTLFSRHDAVFGAGAVCEPLRLYLSATLGNWLRSTMKPAVRRELFAVAAQLTYLTAFAHFDMNRHAEAQRLYLTSIELAREVGDLIACALAFRGLSVQAHALGHPTEALRLAEQAVGIGIRHAPPHQQAFLLCQLAVTQADLGDRRHLHHLMLAERHLERASSGTSPVGAFHAASLAVGAAAAARSRGDHQATVRALHTAVSDRPADERRSRALSLAELAEVQLAAGRIEEACRPWEAFLDLYPSLQSARLDDRLRRLIAGLRPHSRNPVAAAVLRQARSLRIRSTATRTQGAPVTRMP